MQITTGKGKVTITGGLEQVIQKILSQLAPNIEQVLTSQMADLKSKAQEQWLVRRKNSQRSIDKFVSGIEFLTKNGGLSIRGFLRNEAGKYIYYAKVGKTSDSNLPIGTHIVTELMTKPLIERRRDVANLILEELKKLQS
tara:strand:- start:348 stop:767 length:420 start_codon:yes stop_codon:yes gene_type:complete